MFHTETYIRSINSLWIPVSTSITLQRITSSSKSRFLSYIFQSKLKKCGFQDQEAWTKLEIEERSVDRPTWAPQISVEFKIRRRIKLQRQLIVIKVALLEHHLPIKAQEVRLLGPRKWQEARERGAQRTLLVREHHRLPMNASFDVD